MITLIAAIGRNGEIGKDNKLLWNLKGDMKFFKETTLNHKVIMGYNTYLSIGKPLPKRKNIVLTHEDGLNDEDITYYNDIDELIKKELNNDEENFIIGGASLYNYFYEMASRMYLTLIDECCDSADIYFPKIDDKLWHKKVIKEDIENNIKYKIVLFERV